MKTKLMLAGILLTGASAALAATENDILPAECKAIVNYNAQILAQYNDVKHPKAIKVSPDYAKFPITAVQSLGNCDDDRSLNPAWCRVAGGIPEVFRVEVSNKEISDGTYPFATIIATYNRGGCWVDATEIK